MAKDLSKPRIQSATTYKLYVISCIIVTSGIVLMFKFPEMQSLDPGIDPLSLTVLGLTIKIWKAVHVLASLALKISP